MTTQFRSIRRGWMGLALCSLVPAGCGPDHYIQRIESRPDRSNAWFVHKLGEFPRSEQATMCLIEQLQRDDPGARFYAADSLGPHLMYCSDNLRLQALLQLAEVLDDARFDTVSFPIHGPLLPGGSMITESSVRIRALATLAKATQQDFGFDSERWRTFIRNRYGLQEMASVGAERCQVLIPDQHPIETPRP